MAEIRGNEKLDELISGSRLAEFNLIEALEYRVLENDCTLFCVLKNQHGSSGNKIELRFLGVTSFKVDDLNWQDPVIMGFDIVDISGQGWEGLNWEVLDYENGRIHFYAREAEIVDVSSSV